MKFLESKQTLVASTRRVITQADFGDTINWIPTHSDYADTTIASSSFRQPHGGATTSQGGTLAFKPPPPSPASITLLQLLHSQSPFFSSKFSLLTFSFFPQALSFFLRCSRAERNQACLLNFPHFPFFRRVRES